MLETSSNIVCVSGGRRSEDFPCFSSARGAHWCRRQNQHTRHVIKWVRNLARRGLQFAVLENVTGIKARGPDGKRPVDVLVGMLSKGLRGWLWQVWTMNSKDYGLAQNRPRVYIVGVNCDRHPCMPAPVARPRLAAFLVQGGRRDNYEQLTNRMRENLKHVKRELHHVLESGARSVVCIEIDRDPTRSWGRSFRIDDLVPCLKVLYDPRAFKRWPHSRSRTMRESTKISLWKIFK